ncbi:membrane protein [Mycolicibacterium litorale]|uniref:Membrane protein n=1 Tax=Mycolicibacterium litorale TaxID=758802 RepID=A0A6S6P921_9MYCO|nr:gephyrin-like molybdotransferase receptor GlpR [Mycolicibacterium litorale]BCI55015.1 membrane protein [Mycolicibacterium litorale]
MPSIPQSLLWISLVVLWLFVLVPMLVSKRDAVRRTSDVALSTRVLNSGQSARLLRRSGPAAGHHSDPHWRPSSDELDDLDEEPLDEPQRAVVLSTAPPREAEPDYLDVDVVEEESGALPVASADVRAEEAVAEIDETDETDEIDEIDETDEIDGADGGEPESDPEPEISDAATDPGETEAVDDSTSDEYEYVPDDSGLEASEGERTVDAVSAARRRRQESKTAAAVSARKFRFRKRMVTSMAVALLASALLAYLVAPWAWWLCGGVGAVTVLYLAYLRRQTRIEEQLRRRRAQRIRRSRLGVENTDDSELDVVPARLRRPGAAVLEIDDEDPVFEHLDEVAFARHFDLPRAAGQ